MKPLYQRILERVDQTGGPDACWPWTGTINPNGRGQLSIRRGNQVLHRWAHRLVFELFCHPIPEDLELDHICHSSDPSCAGGNTCAHRRCCNPAHLEPVTHVENMRRVRVPTECPRGHEYTPKNTYVDTYNGSRRCRACMAERQRKYRAARKVAA